MKAVIPAAGLGTRLLPITKAIPKEMLPIVNKPAIHYVVEEAVNSGIRDILLIIRRSKGAIEDYFDRDLLLESFLEKKGKYKELNLIRGISNMVDMTYTRQKEPLGLGHAILLSKKYVGNNYFAVLLGDDIFYGDAPCLLKLIKKYEELNAPIMGVMRVPRESVSKYGIVSIEKEEKSLKIVDAVEKPSSEKAPSNFAIVGRYILPPEIFEYLEKLSASIDNELQLTDAIKLMIKDGFPFYAVEITDRRFDVGTLENWIEANIFFWKHMK